MPMGKFFKQNIVRDGLCGVIAVVDHAADSPLVLTGRKLDHTQKNVIVYDGYHLRGVLWRKCGILVFECLSEGMAERRDSKPLSQVCLG